jgi:sarcosine oxidase subunit alpha
MTEVLDAAIVGAGPAGLAAALEIASRGFRVTVFDEYPIAGGRLLGQHYRIGRREWNGREVAGHLLRSLSEHPTAAVSTRTTVYEIVPDQQDSFLVRTHPHGDVRARRVLVATGASERPVPVPGWTLPGVMTVGGAQVLSIVHGVRPGRRGLIIGSGVLSFAIAAELTAAGVEQLGIVMAPSHPATRHLGPVTSQWAALHVLRAASPPLLRPFVGMMRRPRARQFLLRLYPSGGVPLGRARIYLDQAAVRILGDKAVEAVELQRLQPDGSPGKTSRVVPVDFVLLSGGLLPMTELLYPLGVDMIEEAALGGAVPVLSSHGATSLPGVFVAGNAGGVESGAVALQQGRVTGLAMVHGLGPGSRSVDEALEAAEAQLARERAESPFEFIPGAREAVARRQAAGSGRRGPAS